jgi:adenylate kinase family enzyme
MRIRIIGGCGSGKTYISKLVSTRMNIPHIQTDNLVWNRSNETKHPVDIRDRMLDDIVRQDHWIIEGVHQKWGHSSFEEADYIFIIQTNYLVQSWRTIKRFVKTRLGLEEGNYKQGVKDLFIMMFVWNRGYNKDLERIIDLTLPFREKRYIVKNNMDILKILGLEALP